MQLSLIIVAYNSKKYIESCINSILKSIEGFEDYEIIVVDNNSKDKTVHLIESFLNPKIKIIKEQCNKGYSSAINKAVLESRFEKILILNPDTLIIKDAIDRLFKASCQPELGVIGAKLLNSDGTFQLSSRRHFPSLGILFSYILNLDRFFYNNRFFGRYNYTYLDENDEALVDSVSGACMMFSKELFISVDGFDESFFIYFEDTDFCLKVKEAGFKVVYYPKAQVVHHNNYSDHHDIKTIHFYQSFEKFVYKYRSKISLGILVYYFAKLINKFFHLKRWLVPVK